METLFYLRRGIFSFADRYTRAEVFSPHTFGEKIALLELVVRGTRHFAAVDPRREENVASGHLLAKYLG